MYFIDFLIHRKKHWKQWKATLYVILVWKWKGIWMKVFSTFVWSTLKPSIKLWFRPFPWWYYTRNFPWKLILLLSSWSQVSTTKTNRLSSNNCTNSRRRKLISGLIYKWWTVINTVFQSKNEQDTKKSKRNQLLLYELKMNTHSDNNLIRM